MSERVRRRTALRAGAGLAVGALAGCLGVLDDGEDSPDSSRGLPTPSLGPDDPADAASVVAVWEDYRCPHCATFNAEVLPRARSGLIDDGPAVRLEHHDFPVPVDRWSWRVAIAARSVQERAGTAAFWTFSDRAYARQGELDGVATVREVARQAGADPEAVAADVEQERQRPVVAADRQTGRETGVEGTPTVFVDGERVASSYGAIADAVRASQPRR